MKVKMSNELDGLKGKIAQDAGASNVAASLTNYRIPVQFVTRVTKNYMGNCD